jgi:hypothetical protein
MYESEVIRKKAVALTVFNVDSLHSIFLFSFKNSRDDELHEQQQQQQKKIWITEKILKIEDKRG